ncbi:MAG: aminoacyl-tRNA hydrolase [Caldilineaceae bacterium]|nr:aminoacyl-tRNA hydrolase [Caldilineaceae bacterium]MCB9157502.1 aminoacyl-tRNA hydrolase [Caldilineaceae bacterium]
MSSLKMIVGLGNPGPRYANNRHNIGFRAVELYAERHNFAFSRIQLKASVADGWVSMPSALASPQAASAQENSETRGFLGSLFQPSAERQKVLLAKPQTYMNTSGEAVGALASYYSVEPADILVIHDDLDLAPGQIRLRPGGGSGGQNGVKSIIARLGTPDFPRFRIGIGRPPGRMKAADYVLQDFLKDEAALFAPLRDTICTAIDVWLFNGIDAAMNRFNVRTS